jgi:signal transduction histidine kinase/ligand-binding sensor domain-containing protein
VGAAHRQRRHAATLGAILAYLVGWCQSAFALNPSLDISQYTHTAWKIRDGFAKGTITSIAQTPDGYLWMGTEFGLLRFDGVRNVPWQPPSDQHLPSSYIRGLLTARDGTLWIGTDRGLASWKDGKLTQYQALAGSFVSTLLEDREGSIWTTRFTSAWTLCAIRKGAVQCYGDDSGPGAGAIGLYEDSSGNLWVGTLTGLWRWRPGPPRFYPLPLEVNGIQGLSEDDRGALLIPTREGIRRFVGGETEMIHPFPPSMRPFPAQRLLRDRDGSLWVGSFGGGLAHIHQGITDVFAQRDGLSDDEVWAVIEDREANIWVITSAGLDRFREATVSSVSVKQGLSNTRVNSVLASKDGSVWLGSADGLNKWKDGDVTVYRERTAQTGPGRDTGVSRNVRTVAVSGLFAGGVQSIVEDRMRRVWVSTSRGVGYFEQDRFVPVRGLPGGLTRAIVEDRRGSLWIANPQHGLFRVSPQGDVDQVPWAKLNLKKYVTVVAADPSPGGLWFGFFEGGLSKFSDGRIVMSYAAVDGLAEGRVSALHLDDEGTLWAATEGGLSRLKDGRVATLTRNNGLPCDVVGWVIEDDAHSLWLGMTCGLVRIARVEIDKWSGAVDKDRELKPLVRATVFDNTEGIRILDRETTYFTAPAAKALDGRLWFVSRDGVSVVDPRHIPVNSLPPPVHIEQVTADRKAYDVGSSLSLPPLVRDLQIDYTALSLVAPEKNRFKIKLEGRDRDWQDVGNRRQAFYNNLPPRNYRFRVIASNNNGVWNETGAIYEFAIAPAYYQTTWFRTSVVAGTLFLLWALYQYRVRQLAHVFDARLDERINERTRVARELHDTLLQSFHGALFRFQATVNMLPERPAEAKQTLESAIDRAAQAITEGRDAIQDLRASTVVTNDLAVAISTLGDELAASGVNGNGTVVHVAVQGTTRDLHPILRDDIYRIAGEALRNAFRHAHARRIEVEITYDDRQFRLQVRDDGKGIDKAVLADDRRGHFGLPGMRERAELVGGHLDVWSEVGAGTEIDLTIPAAKAYTAARARRRAWWFAKKTGTEA